MSTDTEILKALERIEGHCKRTADAAERTARATTRRADAQGRIRKKTRAEVRDEILAAAAEASREAMLETGMTHAKNLVK